MLGGGFRDWCSRKAYRLGRLFDRFGYLRIDAGTALDLTI